MVDNYLEQMSACAASISELEFPGPKQFENSLLASYDITALIRDTEVHERALFSIAPPPLPSHHHQGSFGATVNPALPYPSSSRSGGVHHPGGPRAPKRNTAVAAVLGRDLFRKVREADGQTASAHYGPSTRAKGEVDVRVLLQGAERLCEVYSVPGAKERIEELRTRFEQLNANIAHYESRVARNAVQLEGMYARHGLDGEEGGHAPANEVVRENRSVMTQEDLAREESEIADLEIKKRALEGRVSEMEKDLGGLLR